jgi:hypothetical protein
MKGGLGLRRAQGVFGKWRAGLDARLGHTMDGAPGERRTSGEGCPVRRKRKVARKPQWRDWPLGWPEMNSSICVLFKHFSNGLGLIQSKNGLPVLENFQIKYGFVGN